MLKRLNKELKLLVALLALQAAACSNGPKVIYWIIDTQDLVSGDATHMSWEQAAQNHMRCLSPDDLQRAMRSCKERLNLPKDLNHCIFDLNEEGLSDLACSDGNIYQPIELLNWACLTPQDEETIILFCRDYSQEPKP